MTIVPSLYVQAGPDLRIGVDGLVPSATLPRDGCCPPSLCQITPCMLACNFVSALPKGPLWDRPKAIALAANLNGSGAAVSPPECSSIVSHAVYAANRTWVVLMDALWPALRESDPFTCFDTVDDWLQRLGWIDCFASACRDPSLGHVTPLEVLGDCNCVTYAPPAFPAELVLAVKLGVVRSLSRLGVGIVPTLDTMNFVLEPLGAVVTGLRIDPDPAPGGTTCDPAPCLDNSGEACCPPGNHPVLGICNASDTLPKPRRLECAFDGVNEPYTETIPAYYDTTPEDADGLPPRIWPGILAAECILRSVIFPSQNVSVERCAGTLPE